ncbi:hypothetical protein KGEDBEEJ_00753 [Aeromonas hydrophila]
MIIVYYFVQIVLRMKGLVLIHTKLALSHQKNAHNEKVTAAKNLLKSLSWD